MALGWAVGTVGGGLPLFILLWVFLPGVSCSQRAGLARQPGSHGNLGTKCADPLLPGSPSRPLPLRGLEMRGLHTAVTTSLLVLPEFRVTWASLGCVLVSVSIGQHLRAGDTMELPNGWRPRPRGRL